MSRYTVKARRESAPGMLFLKESSIRATWNYIIRITVSDNKKVDDIASWEFSRQNRHGCKEIWSHNTASPCYPSDRFVKRYFVHDPSKIIVFKLFLYWDHGRKTVLYLKIYWFIGRPLDSARFHIGLFSFGTLYRMLFLIALVYALLRVSDEIFVWPKRISVRLVFICGHLVSWSFL